MITTKYATNLNATADTTKKKISCGYRIIEHDIRERHVRIPLLKELYERKLDSLASFQKGNDIFFIYFHQELVPVYDYNVSRCDQSQE